MTTRRRAMQGPQAPALAARLFGPSPERRLALMRAAWPAAVGSELARRTEIVSLDAGVLRIRVPDAGWQRGLARMRGDLLCRLRGIAGAAAPRSLGFVLGQVAAPPPEPLLSPEQEGRDGGTAPEALQAAADSIPDPELRARFLSVAARYLRRFAKDDRDESGR
jgi:hypothetical protein